MKTSNKFGWFTFTIIVAFMIAVILVGCIPRKESPQPASIIPKSNSHVTGVPTTNMLTPPSPVTTIELSSTPRPDNNVRPPVRGMTLEEAIGASPDTDGDNVVDVLDNCPYFANPDQADNNGDGVGDVCYVFELARKDLVKRLDGNVAVPDIMVNQVTEVIWPDTCLGIPSEAPCTAVETPGYRLILQEIRTSGQKYLYHTDKFEIVRFVEPVDNTP